MDDAGRRTRGSTPPLRYLSSANVDVCLPPVRERVDLARRALGALAAGEAELPPKMGVHPREGALLHAMPAWLRTTDLVGLKWVSAFPDNARRGLAAISGLVVLNDAATGLPTWVMDAARITAVRTAAVSGVALTRFASPDSQRVAVLGAGVQAHSHLEVISELLPRASVVVYNRTRQRAEDLARQYNEARGTGRVGVAGSVGEAVDGAQVVISVATLGATAERLGPADVAPGTLVVAVDFATYVDPEMAREARAFVVDDRGQFLRYRELGYFDGYPDPTGTLGDEPSDGARASDGRPTLVTHLGVGLADVVLADAIVRVATQRGVGLELER